MTEYYEDFVRPSSQTSDESYEGEIYEEFCEQLYEFGSDVNEEENEYEDFDPNFRRRSLSHGAPVLPNKTFMKGLREKFVAGSKGTKLGALLKDKQLLSQQVKKLTHFPFHKKAHDVTYNSYNSASSTPSSPKTTRSLDKLWRKQGVYNSATTQKTTKEEVDNVIYRSNSPEPETVPPHEVVPPRSPRQIVPKRINLPCYETVEENTWTSNKFDNVPQNSPPKLALAQPPNTPTYSKKTDNVSQNPPSIPPKKLQPANTPTDYNINPFALNLLMKQLQEQVHVRDTSEITENNPGKYMPKPHKMTSPIRLEKDESELYDRLDVSR